MDFINALMCFVNVKYTMLLPCQLAKFMLLCNDCKIALPDAVKVTYSDSFSQSFLAESCEQ